MNALASDFDLTLYVDDMEVVKKNIEAISKFMKMGNLFCIVTGRNYSDIKLLLNQYHIPYHYLICQDGAKIFDSMDYCFSTVYLSRDKIEKVLEVIKKYSFCFYLDDGYNKTSNINDCVKVVVSIENQLREAESLVEELRGVRGIYVYISSEHVNITDISVNKHIALEKMLEHAGLNKSLLYTIGDNINDLEMLTHFKGAIMKDHAPILNGLNYLEYEHLYDYIEELSKN